VLGVLAFQVLGMVMMGRRFESWRRGTRERPQGPWRLAWFAILPLALHAIWAAVVLVGMPRLAGMPMQAFVLFSPDLGYAIWLSGVVSLGWVMLASVGTSTALRSEVRAA